MFQTADCDFDENDEGKGLIDFAWDQKEGGMRHEINIDQNAN